MGCQDTESRKLNRLDRQRGINEFVLGDSLYGRMFRSYREQSGNSEALETEVLGHVSTSFMRRSPVEFGNRFLFGITYEFFFLSALNGRIFACTIYNTDIPSTRVQALEDSLIATFGPPTHVLDSIYVTDGGKDLPASPKMSGAEVVEVAVEKGLIPVSSEIDSTRSSPRRRWQGESVSLQLQILSDQGFALELRDRIHMSTRLSIEQEIDSTLMAGTFGSIRKVGDFPLLTTKQNPLIETKESSFSSGKDYAVPYEALQSFFGVKNRSASQAISTSAEFSSTSDSLSQLTVAMDKFVEDSDSYGDETFMTMDEVREVLQSSLGDPALTTKTKTPEGEVETTYWPGSPFSIIAKEGRIQDEISVTFTRTESVGVGLYQEHSSNALYGPSPMDYLPWPENK